MPPQQRRGKGSPSPARKHKAKAKSLAPAGSSVTCWGVTLEADQVESLRGYKYCCDNKSVLCNSWICIAFWEWIAQRVIPMSMTPNAVTILGAMCSYSVFICGHLFQPAMTTDSEAFWWLDGGEKSVSVIDSWTPETKLTSPYSLVCITGMGLLVLYNTLDNVDGKVARNRGMGSPLGQWMDHGCDSLTMCLALCVLCNLMQLTGPWMLALFVVGSWVWLGVAWEEHYTHCLRMDYFCSDESEYFCVALGCYTLYAGPQIWTATVYTSLLLAALPVDIAAVMPFTKDNELCVSLMLFGQVTGLAQSFIIVKAKVARQGLSGWWSEEFFDALRDLFPFMAFCVAFVGWGQTLVGLNTDANTTSLFLGAISVSFARMSLSLIHSTLTGRIFSSLQWEPLVPAVGMYISSVAPELQRPYLIAAFLGGFLAFFHKHTSTANVYAKVLGINVVAPPSYGADGKALPKQP